MIIIIKYYTIHCAVIFHLKDHRPVTLHCTICSYHYWPITVATNTVIPLLGLFGSTTTIVHRLMVENCVALGQMCLDRLLDLQWRCYHWNLLSYYYFAFLSAIFIFRRRRCRPLSLHVTCKQLDFSFGTISVSVTIGRLFVYIVQITLPARQLTPVSGIFWKRRKFVRHMYHLNIMTIIINNNNNNANKYHTQCSKTSLRR